MLQRMLPSEVALTVPRTMRRTPRPDVSPSMWIVGRSGYADDAGAE